MRPRRSALFMPASNERAIAKARSLACDVVILDLEDAVAPEQKEQARDAAADAIAAGGFAPREIVLRCNAIGSEWARGDIAAAAAARPDALLLPKVSSPDTLWEARGMLGAGPALWAMIETCRAIVDLPSIVAVADAVGLEALVLGPNDLAKDMRCRPGVDRAPLLPAMAQVVTCARMAGIVALDGVCNAIDDPVRVEAECRQGLAWGFDGKTLIHPTQIAPANTIFAPDADEVAWARTVVEAFDAPDNAGKGVIRVDGKMVELLHRDEAQRVLALADAIDERAS